MAQSTRRKINWIKTFYMLRQRKDTIKRDMRRFLHLSHHKGNLSILCIQVILSSAKGIHRFPFVVSFNFRTTVRTPALPLSNGWKSQGILQHMFYYERFPLWYLTSFKRIHNPYFLLRIWVEKPTRGFESSFCLVFLAATLEYLITVHM